MKNHDPKKATKKNDQRIDLMILYIIVMFGAAILLTIAIYGIEAKAAVQEKAYQTRIEEIDRKRTAREAAREVEWADARQEIHEYFYEQKMEEKDEDIQTSAVILQQEFNQLLTPLAIEVLEARTEAVTEEPETMEVTEDDINEETEIFFEEPKNVPDEVETTKTEQKEAKIEMIEAEEEIKEDDDWFETQPIVEQQPEVKHDEPISEPTVVNTPAVATKSISYQENSDVNISLQNFLNYNGMTLEDFIVRMTCMVYPEACGEGFTGKQGVAEVAVNWIYSGLITEWWDISSGFANIPVQKYYELWYSPNEYDREAISECRRAVESVISGAHPVEDLLGVKPYYFLLPEKSDPINVYVMLQATYQIWIGNQLYLGMEGIDWTQKTN